MKTKGLILISFLFVIFGCKEDAYINKEMKLFTKQDILKDLDDAGISNPYKLFPQLEDGLIYICNSRINLYADKTRWAIVVERSGYNSRSVYAEVILTYFGNCLANLDSAGLNGKYISNTKIFQIITDEELLSVQEEEYSELVSSKIDSILIRNQKVLIEHDANKYHQKGIEIRDFDNPANLIDFPALIRYLNEEHPELFRATEGELRTSIPKDLPKLMVIDQWYHQDYLLSFPDRVPGKGTSPSEYETFQMIADVLVTKDISRWKPTLKPNNNWRNWDSGNL